MTGDMSSEVRGALATGAIFPGSADAFASHVVAGDWSAALGLVRAARRLEVLSSWWTSGSVDAETLRALLPGAWSESQVGAELVWWPLFRDAGYSGAPLPPDEPIIAHRGGQPGDPVGLAWTMDRDAAVAEACRWPRAASVVVDGTMLLTGEIVTAQLPRAKVVARVERAGVDELIAHPRSVRIIGHEPVRVPVR